MSSKRKSNPIYVFIDPTLPAKHTGSHNTNCLKVKLKHANRIVISNHMYLSMLFTKPYESKNKWRRRRRRENCVGVAFVIHTCFHFYSYFLFCVAELYDFPSKSEFSNRTLLLCVLCVVKHSAALQFPRFVCSLCLFRLAFLYVQYCFKCPYNPCSHCLYLRF